MLRSTDIWRSIASTGGARAYALFAQLVLLTLTARWLGPEGRGVIAAVTSWVLLFSTISFLSLGQVALHHAAGRTSTEWLGPAVGSLLSIGVVVTFIAWGVAAILYLQSGSAIFGGIPGPLLLLGFAALPFLIWEQYGSSLLIAVGKLHTYNLAQYIGRTVGIVLLVVLVWQMQLGVTGALIAILVSQVITSAFGVRLLRKLSAGSIAPRRQTILLLLSGGLRLHLNAIGTVAFSTAGILVVQHYHGAVETGWYQLPLQLISAVVLVPQAAAMVLYGEVARLGADGAWATNKHVLLLVTAGMVLVTLIAALAAPLVILVIAGAGFAPSIPIFRILCLGVVGQTLSILLAPQWIGRGLFWQVSILTLVTGTLNLAANIVVVPRYGMYGAAWVFVGTYVLSILVNGGMALYWDAGLRARSAHAT